MQGDYSLPERRSIVGGPIRQKLRRGIFVLPSFITTLSFFSGFYALIASFNEQYRYAAYAIILAGVFDFLDGKVARLTNTTSHFGMEYDSLSDLMSFGIAPGFLVYSWALQPFGRIGWMAAFLYVICGALRLARFNTLAQSGKAMDRFVGLPIPAAAAVIASTVIFTKDLLLLESINPFLLVGTVYVLAFLMVSNVRYVSFKQFDLKRRKAFGFLVFMVLAIYILAVIPELVVVILALGYALSGPAEWAWNLARGKKPSHESSEALHTPRS